MGSLLKSMAITFKHINNIEYPIFNVTSNNFETQDGVLFLDGKVLDDKNQSGNSMGIRRLQTPLKNLYPLKRMINSFNGLIKQNKLFFIDNNGNHFEYKKTKYAKLKYYRIKQIIPKKVSSVIRLEGIPNYFTIPRPPKEGMLWVGVLHLEGIPWLLYEYSEKKLKDTTRKI